MKFSIVTNNPLVLSKLGEEYEVEYFDVSYREIFVIVRDRIQQGYELLSHPLSGSVKPNETPYKSVMVSKTKMGKMDFRFEEIMENAILTCDKFPVKFPELTERMDRDFQIIDLTLIQGALSQVFF